MADDDRGPQLTRFQRLEIQMESVVPLLRRLQQQLGEQVVLDALQRDLEDRIQEAGARWRERGPEPDLSRVMPDMAAWADGGALDYEVGADDADRVEVDVTGCRYAELMDRLEATDLGRILICGGDHVAAARGGLRLDRTSTHMAGGDVCDFRFTRVEIGPEPGGP